MNFLDLVIIGGLLLGGLTGYRRGLINSLISTVATVVSQVIAFSSYKTIAPILNIKLGIGKMIQAILRDTMTLPVAKTQTLGSANPLDKITLVTNSLPSGLQKVFNQMIQESLQNAVGTVFKTTGDVIAHYFALVIVSMLAFFLIFLLSNFVLQFIGNTLTKGFDKSMVGTINTSGGFITGGLLAALFISIIVGFLVPLFALYSPTLARLVQQSVLTKYFLDVFVALNNFIGM